MKYWKIVISLIIVVWLTGTCAISTYANDATNAQGAEQSVTEEQVTVTISTDKKSYDAGEEIHYTMTIENNRTNWNSDTCNMKYTLTEGLVEASEGSMPTSLPIIHSGESYTIEGSLIGQEEIFGKAGSKPTGLDEGSTKSIWIVGAVAGVILVVVILFLILKKKKGNNRTIGTLSFLLMAVLAAGTILTADSLKVQAEEYETITLRPYLKVQYAGQEVTIRAVMELRLFQEKLKIDSADRNNVSKITCHDPSIFRDTDGTYYIVGSFLGGGSTKDLQNWTNLDTELQLGFSEETKEKIRAWNADSSAGSWNSYLWAPDIIYNTAMQKYCIYLSANGDDWKSNIVLLTADSVTGPYEYAGSIVYSGFTEEDYDKTDVALATGEETIAERYVTYGVKNKKWGDMYPNVIDPCVFYDKEGNLWMSYGSWSGGIFMLQLDEETGLRDYSIKYEDNLHSDPYFGTKIAGGAYVSGEGSYIQQIGEYYYLFLSYGNLEAKGGYNVRVYRSERPDGDYVDEKGNTPYYDTYQFNYNDAKGIRLFGGYKWRSFNYGQVAQGHNSAFVDEDGKAYMVFHTRTTDGTEGHYVKVHQLFVNEDGWLVAAPFATSGETLAEKKADPATVAGQYEVILHDLEIDYANLETKRSKLFTLMEDGTIAEDPAGSWSVEPDTGYITLTIDGQTYHGVTLEMNLENTMLSTQVFTALGVDNQLTLWGMKAIE